MTDEKQYEGYDMNDPVTRTLILYSTEVDEVIKKLKEENPGTYDHVKYEKGKGIIHGFFPHSLEKEVQELTGDPEARLYRTMKEHIELISRITSNELSEEERNFYVELMGKYKESEETLESWRKTGQWIDEKFRKENGDKE